MIGLTPLQVRSVNITDTPPPWPLQNQQVGEQEDVPEKRETPLPSPTSAGEDGLPTEIGEPTVQPTPVSTIISAEHAGIIAERVSSPSPDRMSPPAATQTVGGNTILNTQTPQLLCVTRER